MASSGGGYQLVYTQAARRQLQHLIVKARELGLSPQLLAAVREVEQRLRTDPVVFGDPWAELKHAGFQARTGGRGLLYVNYLVYLAKPIVFIGRLRGSGDRGF